MTQSGHRHLKIAVVQHRFLTHSAGRKSLL
jgi:hypothetical protein